MENTISPNTVNSAIASTATPFPASGDANDSARTAASGSSQDASASTGSTKPTGAAAAAVPIVDRIIRRATSSAHGAVDSVAAKVNSLTDGLQDGAAKAGDTRDEWLEAARDAIRQHPLATVAGALVVGAALLSLVSSRRD